MPIDRDVLDRLHDACASATSWLDARTRLMSSIEEGDEDRHKPLVWGLGYHDLGLSSEEARRREGAPYGPAWEMDGTRFPPPLVEVGQDVIDAWSQAREAVDLPVAQARFGDLLWVRKARPRPDVAARAAIEAFLALAECDTWSRMDQTESLERALEIAVELRDADSQARVTTSIVDAISRDLDDEDWSPGISMTLARALVDLRAPIESEKLDALLVRCGERYGRDPYIADGVTELRGRLASPDEVERLRHEQVQGWRDAAQEGDAFLRVHRLERALELARLFGLSTEADAILTELQEISADELDLEAVSTEVSLDADEVERFVQAFIDPAGWEQSLTRLGSHGPPGGGQRDLEEQINRQMEQFPLQYLVTKVIVGPDRATAIFRADDPHSHRRVGVAELRARHARMWAIFAAQILERIFERHGRPSSEELARFFWTDLIPPELAERIARSVELYLDGWFDESAHMLAPRIEAVFRQLARRVGLPVLSEPRGDKPGGVRTLGAILDSLRPKFSDDAWHGYLVSLLIDQLGLNLRNSVAHSLTPRVEQLDAALLIHAALYLRLLGISDQRADS